MIPITAMMDKQTNSRTVGGGIWLSSRGVYLMRINVQWEKSAPLLCPGCRPLSRSLRWRGRPARSAARASFRSGSARHIGLAVPTIDQDQEPGGTGSKA